MSKFTYWLTATVTALSISSHASADHLTSKYLFAARMNGAQEVPAVSTNAVGLGTFNLSARRDTICIEATFNGLSGPVTGVHIHEGLPGTSGPVVLDLMPYLSGNMLKATIAGSALTPQFIQKMFSGMFYLNAHTAANTGGEIRGQIVPESDLGMMVKMDGAQQSPPVVTGASGLAFFWLAKHNGKLSFRVVADGLSGAITGAHLHQAVSGQSGPVIQDLMPFVSGNTIIGSVDPAPYLNALLSDSLYINIHTAANAGGEIRGQLTVMPYLYYDAYMDGAQEVPAVTTSAAGLTVMRMNYTFDTLWYDMQVTGLSGPIQAAHFHKGNPGVSGGVLIGIPGASITGNTAMDMITGAQLADSFVNFLNMGSLYVNAHTAANASGEIRGQLYRTFREGYTFHIDGNQETPAVASNAYGTGMVSIDRDQTNAHYMTVVNGISPGGIHFHSAVAGQSGAVIYDLTSMYSNGGIFGYWRENDMTVPFTAAISNKFRKDSIYINYHTAANPNGEIRGNTSRMLCLPAVVNDIANIGGVHADISLYPNPARSAAMLRVEIGQQVDATVQLTDIMGRKLWMRPVSFRPGINNMDIPLVNVPAGVYIIDIITGKGLKTLRLVKE